jgi:nucleoside-diphosphate-sugar epimerase
VPRVRLLVRRPGGDVAAVQHTFGPRQSARAVIPTILGQLLAGADRVRLGSLRPRRDFTFVEDTVDGFVRMGQADLAAGAVVQLGTGRSVSVAEVLDACCAVVGRRVDPVTVEERVRPAASEVEVLLSDPSRATQAIGWKPVVDLEDGLARTAGWLRPRVTARTAGRYQR